MIFLAGLPFAHFVLPKTLDPWHAQTAWSEAWIVALWLVGEGKALPNRPLTAWALWTTGAFFWLWHHLVMTQKVYPAVMLMAIGHALMIVLFYQAATSLWTADTVRQLGRWVARATLVLLAYGTLQHFSLDQFFQNLSGTPKDEFVGTIGNPTHFGVQLTVLLPLLLLQRGWRWKLASLWCVGLILRTASATAIVAGWLVMSVWLYRTRGLWGVLSVVFGGLLSAVWLMHGDGINPHGRLEAWKVFWTWFQEKPVTGAGLGFLAEASRQITEGPLVGWRHVHNEWFQIALEQGLIGLGLVGWILVDGWRRLKVALATREAFACVLMLLAFGIGATLTFPMHLWAIGAYGLFAYCGSLVMAECPS